MENIATYSPEDNKLRLYVGRVPREDYLKLRAEGWTSTPKQDCDFVAHWTPQRRDTALSYAGIILDEDQTPEDRAADRAERFSGYRDKRTSEAIGHADAYDSAPGAFGFQSPARAERAVARVDRVATLACDAWSKADYWQRRTAGVISHTLHVSSPAVRMGRIKTLEAEQRKHLATLAEYTARFNKWKAVEAMTDAEKQTRAAIDFAGGDGSSGYHYKHPRPESASEYQREHGTSLYTLLTLKNDPITGAEAAALWLCDMIDPASEEWENSRLMDWARHYELRLAYENQMLQAQGGRAAFVEMEVGGFIGGKQIHKVNKSPVTGRVVSVLLRVPRVHGWTYKTTNVGNADFALMQYDTERLPANAYTPPTDADKAALSEILKAVKSSAPKKEPCPLINPTDEDAQRLQDVLNERARDSHAAAVKSGRYYGDFTPASVRKITQAVYSANSQGAYARAETRGLCRDAQLKARFCNLYNSERDKAEKAKGNPVCMIRTTSGGDDYFTPKSVIVLTDKPQKSFPRAVWTMAAQPAPAGELFAL